MLKKSRKNVKASYDSVKSSLCQSQNVGTMRALKATEQRMSRDYSRSTAKKRRLSLNAEPIHVSTIDDSMTKFDTRAS